MTDDMKQRERVTALIERGRQVGANRLFKRGGCTIYYVSAVQKKDDKYIAYTDECDLDNNMFHENEDTERITEYDSLDEYLNGFEERYGVRFEDFGVSKGNKFFHI